MASFHVLLLISSLIHLLVFGQDQEGFISLDCGHPANFTYSEPTSGITYISDAAFIGTGRVNQISANHVTGGLEQQLRTLRSFPLGTRNCYRIEVVAGTKYLIRASFLHGNYGGESGLPTFDLHFGANIWASVVIAESMRPVHKEIIHIVSGNRVEICLVNSGFGIPFISALELRPLKNTTYDAGNRSLTTFLRLDIGNSNRTIRHRDDVYDRIWESESDIRGRISYQPNSLTSMSNFETIVVNDNLGFRPPQAVMSTAVTMKNSSSPLEFSWQPPDITADFYIYLYFAELQRNLGNQSREFSIFINNNNWLNKTMAPLYLSGLYSYSTSPTFCRSGTCQASLIKSVDSELPPILNAVEIYHTINLSRQGTFEEDVEAITGIKVQYRVERNWQGDPCAPKFLSWQGLDCSFNESEPQRITSLNLSSTGLVGEIAHDIAELKKLEILDLSNNSLSGSVPDFLTQLPLLRVLNLERNNLSGPIPPLLTEKSNDGSLLLSISENPNLLTRVPGGKKLKKNMVVLIVISTCGFLLIIVVLTAAIFWRTKCRKQEKTNRSKEDYDEWEAIKRRYSYSDIRRITSNFERSLGANDFGIVYYGLIDSMAVAVKMLSSSSAKGYMQFQAEVDLLMRVHHKNLTSVVGYCNEGDHKGLIYEYMGKGNLSSLLSMDADATAACILNWKDRLQIALDAAQGLDYLHNGVEPAIIHRNVKTANILLNDNNETKVSDFGLSKISPSDDGYIDPEYSTSSRLTESSDVYSYGVVLLEIITRRQVFIEVGKDEKTDIRDWVSSRLSGGEIWTIVDPKLNQDFEVNSLWKAVEIALACSSRNSASRPDMSQVVIDLKESLAMELKKNLNSNDQLTQPLAISQTTTLAPR